MTCYGTAFYTVLLCYKCEVVNCENFSRNINLLGAAVAQLVEALHYKPEGRGFDFRLEFFIDIILSAALWPSGRLSL
jgi:hypothetical protein